MSSYPPGPPNSYPPPGAYGSDPGAPRVPPRQRNGLRIAGLWVLVLGAIATVVGIAALVFSFITMGSLTPSGLLDDDGGPGPDAVGYTELPGEFAADLTAGQTYRLYLSYDDDVAYSPHLDEITVTAPSGEEVRPRLSSTSTSSTRAGTTVRSVRDLEATESGTYRVTLTGPRANAARDVEQQPDFGRVAAVLAPVPDDGGAGGVVSSVLGIITGIGLPLTGGLMIVVGLVLWLVGRSRS